MSELLKILTVCDQLLQSDRTADELAAAVEVSVPTLKRYLGELRHLGCQIVSRRESAGWVYRLENPEAVELKLGRWLRLERGRTLLA
jgi:predicted DNA-binding transcriptional regulator YafY